MFHGMVSLVWGNGQMGDAGVTFFSSLLKKLCKISACLYNGGLFGVFCLIPLLHHPRW
jgi:hypothetical protein